MKKKIIIKPWIGALKRATLHGRPHRFSLTISFLNHKKAGAHCVNPGRGEGLMRKGTSIWVSAASNQLRSLKWTWEIERKRGTFVGTNSVTANRLISELLLRKEISGLCSMKKLYPEHTTVKGVRLDFLAILRNGSHHYIEVKNCHLRYPDGFAYFPDSKTQRSSKHLLELRRKVRNGHRASLFIAVQRSDISILRPSDFHDSEFAAGIRRAANYGVSIRAFRFKPTLTGFIYAGEIEVDLEPYCTKKISVWSRVNEKHSGWNHWNSEKDICS